MAAFLLRRPQQKESPIIKALHLSNVVFHAKKLDIGFRFRLTPLEWLGTNGQVCLSAGVQRDGVYAGGFKLSCNASTAD
jgi:hypothetical protein